MEHTRLMRLSDPGFLTYDSTHGRMLTKQPMQGQSVTSHKILNDSTLRLIQNGFIKIGLAAMLARGHGGSSQPQLVAERACRRLSACCSPEGHRLDAQQDARIDLC